MPTAIPAASEWPTSIKNREDRRRSRIIALVMALPMAVTFAFAEAPAVAASASPTCSSHASLSRPPKTIRVLRHKTGRIDVVNFREYVVTVMGKEWPSYLPQPVIEAGAIAVKQYAWYHTVYTSRSSNGRCFDVKDGTGDQLYSPSRARVRPDHYRAMNTTWNVSLRKDGRFFMTGYRRGERVSCGRDATGFKLMARSATLCARKGWGWQQLVREYYGPRLTIVGAGGATAQSSATAVATATPQAASATTAVRLSSGMWVGPTAAPSQPNVATNAGYDGGLTGGLAGILERDYPLADWLAAAR